MYKRDRSNKIHLIIGSVVVIVLIFLSVRKTLFLSNAVNYITTPVFKITKSVNTFFTTKFDFLVNIGKLKSVNDELVEENNKLLAENNVLKIYKKENEELRKLLKLKQDNTYEVIAVGEVIAMPISNWNTNLIINVGEDDNIKKNMVVINSHGLIGKIVEVNKTTSKIRPIIDERSSVSCLISRNSENVILKGNNLSNDKNSCKLEYITFDADILEGDNIITSNISEIYPKGINVGKVKKIKSNDKSRKKTVLVEPVVNIEKVQKVMIIKNKHIVNNQEDN